MKNWNIFIFTVRKLVCTAIQIVGNIYCFNFLGLWFDLCLENDIKLKCQHSSLRGISLQQNHYCQETFQEPYHLQYNHHSGCNVIVKSNLLCFM